MEKSKHRGFSDAERKRGRDIAIARKQENASARRAQVHVMLAKGTSKAEIARHFNVSWETINRDSKIIAEDAGTPAAVLSVVEGVLNVARRELRGEITSLEAKDMIEQIIANEADRRMKEENGESLSHHE